MGAELKRKREGLPTRTTMSEKQLKEFASTPHAGLPKRKKPAPKRNKAFYGES